jgi:uncharacterized membrane protein SpoIIM required for sporulation
MILKSIYIMTVQISILIFIIYIFKNLIVLIITKNKNEMTDEEIQQEVKDFSPELIKFLYILKNNPILLLFLYIIMMFIPLLNVIFSLAHLKEIID